MLVSWCCAVLAAAASAPSSSLAAINYDNDDIELRDYLQHDTEHEEAGRRWYSPPKVYHHHNDHQHERNHSHQHLQDHKHKVLAYLR